MLNPVFNIQTLSKLTGKPINSNMNSIMEGLITSGSANGLERPHRLVMYLAQTSHESMDFRYDREIWGPTAAQKRYEGRKDLGNTQPGDGKKFAGHTGMQITGRANTTEFRDWVWKNVTKLAPNFVENPQSMNTDPWEGIGPIWFWTSRNLNKLADMGRLDLVSKRINGGYNGYKDRCDRYGQFGSIVLGYYSGDVREFQQDNGLVADGIVGTNTRRALHEALKKRPDYVFGKVSTRTTTNTKATQKTVPAVKKDGWFTRFLKSLFS